MNSTERFQRFEEFWPYYVAAHSKPVTRFLHYLGTLTLVPLITLAFVHSPWWLLLYPVLDYAFAWTGHYLVEKNRPATFGYPFWSAIADFKMFWFMLTGRMKQEVQRCVARETGKAS